MISDKLKTVEVNGREPWRQNVKVLEIMLLSKARLWPYAPDSHEGRPSL